MLVWLVDGTYELFRHYYAVPARRTAAGEEVGAVRAVLGSLLRMYAEGATHLGVATDHVVESFRNELWPGYKTGAGIEPALAAQFPLLEEGLRAMGIATWPATQLEADDILAAAARALAADARVTQVRICSPDKDLAQCVQDGRVVQFDRRRGTVTDAAGVRERFGVPPASIPDYLALVGDAADGFPGLPGWGARSAATMLARYERLEAIPDDAAAWDVPVRGAARLARTLREERPLALRFRELARLRDDDPPFADLGELRWRGPGPTWEAWCRRTEADDLLERAAVVALERAPD